MGDLVRFHIALAIQLGDRKMESVSEPLDLPLNGAASPSLSFSKNAYYLYHPTALMKRRGHIQLRRDGDKRVIYRDFRCTAARGCRCRNGLATG